MSMQESYQQVSAHMPKGQNEWATPEKEEQEKVNERLEAFVLKLQAEAKRRVDRRNLIEQRWLTDLRQYHGHYEEDIDELLVDMTTSKVFINLTRPKTNKFMSKMWDLLFPTDDKNWAVNPTPVPELTEGAEEALQLQDDVEDTFNAKEQQLRALEGQQAEAQDPQTAQMRENEAMGAANELAELDGMRNIAQEKADNLKERINEARKRASLMTDEIDDQLKEAMYQAANRDMIEDAAKIGTGVIKGPVLGENYEQRWAKVVGKDGRSMQVLKVETDKQQPEVQRVDPWSFFPDPDYSNVEDGEGVFERDLMNAKQLRRLARIPDINRDALREILKSDPMDAAPSYLADLTNLTKQDTNSHKPQYHVWTFTGPVDHKDLEILVHASEDEEMQELLTEGEIDPLLEMHVQIWFCQGKILRFALHPLDSNETMYSVFSPEKDESSPFGFGIPYLLRHPQAMLNASWRKLMDNSGMAVGPQVVVDRNMISPENGKWDIEASKLWTWKSNDMAASGRTPFAVFDIPSHMTELQNLIEMTRKEMDQVVDISTEMDETDFGPMSRQSGIGIALLMNAANVVYRRAVKNFDDDVTVPMIRRFYHWNMQFSEKDEIKGDYEVDARGSSVLLVREMMAQNLVAIANAFGDHPKFGDWLKFREMLEAIFRSITIPAKEIVKTEREYKADMKEKAENPETNPELQAMQLQFQDSKEERALKDKELQVKASVAEMESDARIRVAEINFEKEMIELAEMMNIDETKVRAALQQAREKTDAMLQDHREERQAKERAMSAEIAMAERTGKSAGGSI